MTQLRLARVVACLLAFTYALTAARVPAIAADQRAFVSIIVNTVPQGDGVVVLRGTMSSFARKTSRMPAC